MPATVPHIQTTRLTLRPIAPRDWEPFCACAMSDRFQYITGKQDLGGAWRLFAAELGHWQIKGFGMWAVTETGGDDIALGIVGPWFPADWPETEIGWIMFEGGEGKGYAFEAAEAARTHVFETLGWDTAVSYIDPQNARSIALAERLGAVRDDSAARPHPDDLVYRHPKPEAG